VLGSLLAANVGVVAIEAATAGRWMAVIDHFTRTGPASALWWVVLTLLVVAPGRRGQGVGLAVLLLIDAYAAVTLWNP
jgi:GNAT superfamily N-acetyltransferase